jgi:hypothetical protein
MMSKAFYWLLTLGSLALVAHSAPLPAKGMQNDVLPDDSITSRLNPPYAETAPSTQVSQDGTLWKDTVHMTIVSRDTETEASTDTSQVGALWKDAVHVTLNSRDGGQFGRS